MTDSNKMKYARLLPMMLLFFIMSLAADAMGQSEAVRM